VLFVDCFEAVGSFFILNLFDIFSFLFRLRLTFGRFLAYSFGYGLSKFLSYLIVKLIDLNFHFGV